MNRRPLAQQAVGLVVLAGLVSCVTINVYFPAAAIKDLSRQIEDEVEKQAAPEGQQPAAEPAPSTPPSAPQAPQAEMPQPAQVESPAPPAGPGQGGGSAGLLGTLLGITPVYAQGDDVAAPEISSPAIRKIIESRATRVAALNKYKAKGVIGENNKALVEIRGLDALSDLKERAEVQRLVKAENADREELFKEIAAAKNVELSQLPKIRETYASTLRGRARPGDWIQDPDGTWKQA